MESRRPEQTAFRCEVEPRRDVVYVRPIGEMDLLTTPMVDDKLTELAEAGFERIVLDLRHLEFLDSTGLHVILAWNDRARQGRFSFSLVRGRDCVQRLFELTATDQLLDFMDPRSPRVAADLPAVA